MARPRNVRSGSTKSSSWQSGLKAAAKPPVAMTSGSSVPGHTALMRRTSPSMESAAPSTTPARMHSSVRRPMTLRGGLYIPDTAKEKPMQGEIIAVGPGRYEDGKLVPMGVKVGDKVLYGKYSGTEVTIDAEQYLILRESDVLAIVN